MSNNMRTPILSLTLLAGAVLATGCGGVSSDNGTINNPNARTPALIRYQVNLPSGSMMKPGMQ